MGNSRPSQNALSGHIHNFARWKKDLTRSLKSYRLWLRRNHLYTEKVDQRIFNLLTILRDDYVTIAFAGEFSRGKTELINAMFFARYGKRILPSQAGRTTMCPTELFFDHERNGTYLKLLPISTREDDRPLSAFRHLDDYWLEFPLDTESADAMAESLNKVTETQWVSPDDAKRYGFDVENLERRGEEELVEIPAWRHALVSFDHPLLQQGLCILDTPGLNALGSEPELTLSLLPRAQAVIFLLAADAGVTASDMAIWDEHISQLKNRPNLGLYAVLNKVDVLWDDLSTAAEIKQNVDKVINDTSSKLDLARKYVIPVSAQKGLLGRVKNDTELLSKSRLGLLEDMLSQSIMGSKERALWESVIADASTLVEDSLTMLTNRRNQMLRQQEELTRLKDVSSSHIQKLLETCEEERSHYQQKMLSIKPSIRLMERQTELLEEVLDPERLQKVIDDSAKGMLTAKSTIGILKSMRQFFFSVDKIMIDFCREAELSNKMAISIYEKYQSEYGLEEFNPRRLTAKRFRSELQSLFKDADQFTSHLQLALTGQHQIVTRFFNTTVFNISEFFEKTRTRLNNWTDNVLHPLLHQINDHKRVLDHHLEELKSIQRSGASAASRLSALKLVLSDLDSEFEQCQTTLDILNQFKPNDERSTILDFRRRLNEETHA